MIKMFRSLIFCIFSILINTINGAQFSGRIVNGTRTTITDYPFMVSLKGQTGYHMCGGSLISNEWVLTAAHCLSNQLIPELYSVQYGVTNITKDGDTIMGVSQIYVHAEFNSMTLKNDIALLRLSNPVDYSTFVSAITLPKQDQHTPDGAEVVVLGWGLNASDGQYQQNLQMAELKAINFEICDLLHYNEISSTNICAGLPSGGKGQCDGDSGGPLIHNNYLIGLVSWSKKPCTEAPYPGVYTQVASYRNWIKTITGF